MSNRQAVIVFMDNVPEDFDLFSYLENELNAKKIETRLVEVAADDAEDFIGIDGVTIHHEEADTPPNPSP